MHRQSLSSPASKHGIVVGAGVIKDDNISKLTPEDLQNHRKEKLAPSAADDEEHQSEKPHQPKSMTFSSLRLIHLIPLLTLFCFVILYLASHDPSGKDLAQFDGFTTLSSKKNVIDSSDFLIEKNDAMAIGGTRSLQQQEVNKRRRFNRRSGN
ncbi:uncharacterized protein LOC112528287 [Cynara cardunculus var. scolymus]|uniref:Transmembrane protein n=1 Tax=Cynara cardunculus var. scolymus TaxID=59895 RepID=A0A103XQT1_CYNCS|nr:uncharacterized protein LOC112528287 [Cynara cardunculus var. scolymus]KVH95181.1 hypothetical protein Ccrd_002756 [Cynara cardunculus var. scolymus]